LVCSAKGAESARGVASGAKIFARAPRCAHGEVYGSAASAGQHLARRDGARMRGAPRLGDGTSIDQRAIVPVRTEYQIETGGQFDQIAQADLIVGDIADQRIGGGDHA